MVQGVCYYLSGGILLCFHLDCSANCCTYVRVLQTSLQKWVCKIIRIRYPHVQQCYFYGALCNARVSLHTF